MTPILITCSSDFADADLLIVETEQLRKNYTPHVHTLAVKGSIKLIQDFCKKYGYQLTVHKLDFAGWGAAAKQKAYEHAALEVKAMLFFWNGEQTDWSYRMKDKIDRVRRVEYKSFKQQLKEAMKAEKEANKTRKKITIPITKESKERYMQAHKQWYIREYPAAYNDGFYTAKAPLPINSGSRMDTFIVNFLVWSGWDATKVNNMGRKIDGKWVASSTKKGTFDLSVTINGRSVKIETKHSTDKPSPEQLAMQTRVRNAGGIAEFVYSVEEFFILYDRIINGEI